MSGDRATGRGLRRGAALAALSGLLTSVGHAAAGGALPDVGLLLVLVPLLAGMFVAVADRSRGLVGTMATLACGQFVLHELLTLLHPAHVAGGGPVSGIGTLVLHGLVTVVTTVALRHAERGLGALRGAVAAILPRRLVPPPADRPLAARPVPDAGLPALIARVLTAADPQRGPPRVGLPPSTLTGPTAGRPPETFMTPAPSRSVLRAGAVLAVAAGTALALATPAFAHVTAQPGEAEQGGYSVVSLRVPNESDTAGTVRLDVSLPTDHPVTSVRTTPIPGWTATMTKSAVNPAVQINGRTISEAVSTVTWTAAPGVRIGPGEYLDFPLSLGPMPTDAEEFVLPATQTYDDGEVVAWDQPPAADGSEPERPAPTVALVAGAAGAGDEHAGHDDSAAPVAAMGSGEPAAQADTDDPTARWLGGAGLLFGALALGAGGGALLRTRQATRSGGGSS